VRWLSTDPAVPTPLLSLAAFARVTVPADGSRTVSLFIEPRAFAVLTDPQCGVVPSQPGKSLTGPPYVVPSTLVCTLHVRTHTHTRMNSCTHARTHARKARPPARPPKRPPARPNAHMAARLHARTHTRTHRYTLTGGSTPGIE
jgi:hypothetical protein